jgi:chaperonin GroES
MIELLLHHVLLEPTDVEEADEVIRSAKALGIHVELDKREKRAVEFGTVVAVGPTAFIDYGRDPSILKKGDKVSFARYSGKEIKDEGKSYLLLNDQDVLCVIK